MLTWNRGEKKLLVQKMFVKRIEIFQVKYLERNNNNLHRHAHNGNQKKWNR